tara:strand:+ start:7339 stop:9714 length:2376 start_codon:yes stop_codon:yes gene_type:complete
MGDEMRLYDKPIFLPGLLGVLILLLFDAAAIADTTEPPLENIIVTAQGRAESLQEVSVSASVVSGDVLEKMNVSKLEDLMNRLPNVSISPAPVSDFVSIRGVGSSLNFGFEQSVATFVDGVHRGRSRSTRASLFDIDRVEVLRGPQTTFFGNNAIAGALNITTRRPDDEFAANASVFYGFDFEEYVVEGGVSLPLSDELALRVAGRQTGMKGYIDNTYIGEDGPNLDDRMGRVSIVWDPSSSFEMYTRFEASRFRDEGIFNTEIVGCPPPADLNVQAVAACQRYLTANGGVIDDALNYKSASEASFWNFDHVEAANKATFHFGEHSLTFTTAYYDHEYQLAQELIGIPGLQGGSTIGADYGIAWNNFEQYEQFSQEIRFQSDETATLSYIFGAYYASSDLSLDVYHGLYFLPLWVFAPPGTYAPGTPISQRAFFNETSDNLSAFGAMTFNVSDKFRVNAGLRYSSVEKEAGRRMEIGETGPGIPGPENFVDGSLAAQSSIAAILGTQMADFTPDTRKDNELMPSISVEYDLSAEIMAYASYTGGFKAGGFAMFFTETSLFEPETVDAYEIGTKMSLLDDKLRLSLNAFYADYSELQETVTLVNSTGVVVQFTDNVASSVSQGIELNAEWRATQSLRLSADIAYLSSEYDSYIGAPCTPLQLMQNPGNCAQDLSGSDRAFAPEWSGNIAFSYSRPLERQMALRIDGIAYFSSSFFMQPNGDPLLRQSGYGKADVRVAIGNMDESWELALVGSNLTDRTIASFRTFFPTSPGGTQVLASAPRSVGIQASFYFD